MANEEPEETPSDKTMAIVDLVDSSMNLRVLKFMDPSMKSTSMTEKAEKDFRKVTEIFNLHQSEIQRLENKIDSQKYQQELYIKNLQHEIANLQTKVNLMAGYSPSVKLPNSQLTEPAQYPMYATAMSWELAQQRKFCVGPTQSIAYLMKIGQGEIIVQIDEHQIVQIAHYDTETNEFVLKT